MKRNVTWAKARQAHKEYLELEAKKADLESKIQALGTPEGIDSALREKYHVVKDGEGLVVITNPPEIESQGELPKQNFWQKTKSFFGSKKD